jgi:Flp pilus assembly protein TadG
MRDRPYRREAGPRPDRWAERGAVTTTFLLTMVPVFVVLLGMVFDFAQAYTAKARALDIAEQAARAGAQQINLAEVRDSGTYQLDEAAATGAAEDFLAAAGFPADKLEADADTVEVTTSWTVSTAFLGIIGRDTFEGSVSASADMEVGVAIGGP